MKRRVVNAIVLAVLATASSLQITADEKTETKGDGWKTIWDGKTLEGWKASENKDAWTIQNGELICHGERSHLFYVGDDQPLKNFEFECEVMTKPGSNAGIYFHTQYQETGWPKYGYECQVNITHSDPKKTGGLYGVMDVADPPAKDNEWYRNYIKVEGRRVIIKVNDKVTVDYTEPEGKEPFSADFERRLGEGTIAFQAHDPKSEVHFRNIRLKRLP